MKNVTLPNDDAVAPKHTHNSRYEKIDRRFQPNSAGLSCHVIDVLATGLLNISGAAHHSLKPRLVLISVSKYQYQCGSAGIRVGFASEIERKLATISASKRMLKPDLP